MNYNITFKKYNNVNVFQLLKDIKIESFLDYYLDNTFCLFKSINDIIYLIYTYKFRTIILYNLVRNKTINQIKKAHNKNIINLRHYLDDINKRDLIISISSEEHNIRVWSVNNLECIFNIKDIYKYGGFSLSTLLNDKNKIYIVVCNNQYPLSPEKIKVFDLRRNKIKEINNSNENSFFIDNYYDNKLSKNYIITGNINSIKSYDYNNNLIYNKYNDYIDEKEYYHLSMIINNKEEIIKLIESCQDGSIRIWNFHSAELLNKIKVSDYCLYGICLWNNEYLYVGCQDSLIKIININKGEVINYLIGHNNAVISIKTVFHSKYGEYLISQGYLNDGIKIWDKIHLFK